MRNLPLLLDLPSAHPKFLNMVFVQRKLEKHIKYACFMSYIEKKEIKGKNLSDVSSGVQKEGRGKFGHRRAAIGYRR